MPKILKLIIAVGLPVLALGGAAVALAHTSDPTPPTGNIVCNPYMRSNYHLDISGCVDDNPGWGTSWGNPDPADRRNLTKDRLISTLMPAGNYKIIWENQCGYNVPNVTQGGETIWPDYSNTGTDVNPDTGAWQIYETEVFFFDPALSAAYPYINFGDHDNCGPGVHLDNVFMYPVGGGGPGWPACSSLSNADFESETNWTLGGTAAISDSILTLATNDYARHDYIIQSSNYTLTIVAKRVSTATNDSLLVGLLGSTSQIVGNTGPIEVVADGDFHEIEAAIGDISYSGDGSVLVSSNQGDYQIDYICLYPGYGAATCTSETRTFDFEDGYNVGDPNWDVTSFGFSQGWRGIVYPINDLYPNNTVWFRRILGIILDGHFEGTAALNRRVAATIKYNYMVVPEVITVTSTINPPVGNATVQILTSSDGSHWSVVDGQVWDTGTTDTIIFTLDYVTPVYVAIAQLTDTGIPVPVNIAMINQVEMQGCYGGPNQFEDCLVGDPDFDMADGYPSTFYWRGNYNEALGAATLQQYGDIWQDFTPPWAGRFTIELVASSTTSPCMLDVYVTNYGSGIPVDGSVVECQPVGQQTFNVVMDLPATPLTLWIEQLAGDSSISRVCITPASGPGQCLNYNPDLASGSGYAGDWYSAGGRVIIPADGKLSAIGVEYQRAEPPYELELIVSPAISNTQADLVINHGNIPGGIYDQAHTITTTSYITYNLESEISGSFGPTLWNQGAGALSILRYCIQPGGVITGVDPFWCATVENPDFTDGLQGWDSYNVMAFNGLASFATDAYVAQGLGDLAAEPTNATVRWLADGYASTVATLTVESESGVFSSSHTISPGNPRFYEDTGTIDGTTAITISAVNSGLELDFICLYPGDTAPYLEPVDPEEPEDGVEIPPGGELAECIAPPMGILPNITETLVSLWPWGGEMTHFEVLMAYNTGWVRFIGCRLDYFVGWMDDVFWGEPWRLGLGGNGLRAKLDQIIFLLTALGVIGIIQAILTWLETIAETADTILDNLLDLALLILYIVRIAGLAILALLGVLVLLAAIIAMLWAIPQVFWVSFRGATSGDTAVALPLPTDPGDPLYNITVGLQLANQVVGGPIAFTICVLAIGLGSIWVLLWTTRKFSEAL